MRQEELDEISEAFQDAWRDYFGDVMFYVPFIGESDEYDSLYKEDKKKRYDFSKKLSFHGTLKEYPLMDELHQSGKKVRKDYEITYVTKELLDKGIKYVNTNDIILYKDRFGREFKYQMVDETQKVQFNSNKIFTKIRVKPYE